MWVVHFPTIPIDVEMLLAAEASHLIVTLDEHLLNNGLGSVILETLNESTISSPQGQSWAKRSIYSALWFTTRYWTFSSPTSTDADEIFLTLRELVNITAGFNDRYSFVVSNRRKRGWC